MSDTPQFCLFCSIADGTVPAAVVMETETVLVFRDINPQAPIHFLAIPKEHIKSLHEVNPQSAIVAEIIASIQSVAEEFNLANDGYRVVTNIGNNGGQTVDHFHFHILGGRALSWPPG